MSGEKGRGRTVRFHSIISIAAVLALSLVAVPRPALALQELQVNTYTTGQQWEPAVAVAPDGSFVVVWASAGQDGDSYGIFGKVFRPNRLSAGEEFQINEVGAGMQRFPTVGIDSSGRFVVAWVESKDGMWRVKARRYGAFGASCIVGAAPLGPEVTVAERPESPDATWDITDAAVGVGPDGKFVVAWVEPHLVPADEDELKFRVYDDQDVPSPLTSVQLVPPYNLGYRILHNPKIGAASWGFLLTWQDNGATYSQWLGDQVAQRYDWGGQSPAPTATLIDTYVEQGGADVAVTPLGTVLIAYRRRQEVPSPDNNVYLVHYGTDGPLHPSPIQVNPGHYEWGQRTYNTGVGVAVGGNDPWDAVVVWNIREFVNGAYEDSILARQFLGGLAPTPTSPDATKLNTLPGFAEVLWGQSPIAMHALGDFKAVWWGGPVGAEIYLRCGKFTQEGEYSHQRCEHDTDHDGIADRYDVHGQLRSIGWDLDRDTVADSFLCGNTKQDCDDECTQLYAGDPAKISECQSHACREDNCIDMDDSPCSSKKTCMDQNLEKCVSSLCVIRYGNGQQEDEDSDGIGDLCDNCRDHVNVGQEDADDDGIGDVCEGEVPETIYLYGKEVDIRPKLPPVEGKRKKAIVRNLRNEPDPFQPHVEETNVSFDLEVLRLPGLPSGKFGFSAKTTLRIGTFDTVRTITHTQPLNDVEVYPIDIAWDGKDDNGDFVPPTLYLFEIDVEVERENFMNDLILGIEKVDVATRPIEIVVLPRPIDIMFVTCGPQPDPLHHFIDGQYYDPNFGCSLTPDDNCIFYDGRCQGPRCWRYWMNVCQWTRYMWPHGDCAIEAVFKFEGQPVGPWIGEYSKRWWDPYWYTAEDSILRLDGGIYYYEFSQDGLNTNYTQLDFGQFQGNKVVRWTEWRPTSFPPYENVGYHVEVRLGWNPG